MQWMELTNLWQALARWLEMRVGRLPLPRPRTMLAVAMGCALLTLHTFTASAGPITVDPGTVATVLCQANPCIGKVKIVPWGDDSGNQYAEFSFTTSIDATVVLAVSTQAPDSTVYYHEFAHVDAATMQLIPAKQHTLDLGVLKANTTYHYALVAVVDEQHRTRVEGTFKTGEPIDSGSHGNPISDE
jgi:hypothetical protein